MPANRGSLFPTDVRDTIRIPLVGSFNSRIADNTVAAASTSGLIGVGVIGSMIIGLTSSSDKDQRFINCLFDRIKNPLTGNESFYVSKRPGFAVANTPAAGALGNAVKVWSGHSNEVITSFGSPNSTIYNGLTNTGSITGITKFVDEANVSSVATILITSGDNTLWYYQSGGAPTKVVDVDFPATITGHAVSLDGYVFIMTPDGGIYASDLNSITSWQATAFLSAQMYPDKGIGLARYKDQIVAFGRETIEFFHIADNTTGTGSPLQRSAQAFVKIGCASERGYVQMEDTIAWISATDRGGCSMYMLEGYTPKRISTATVDTQLALAGPSNVRVECIKLLGKTIILAFTANVTFVYQVEEDIWSQWSSGSPIWSSISSSTTSAWAIYAVSDSRTGGKVYVINPSSLVYQDDGQNFTMTIQTSKVDFGNDNIKFFHKLRLIGDEQIASTTMNVSWSDDDYQTYATSRSINLMSPYPLTRLGSAKRRAWKFTNSSNTPVRLEAMELQFSVGNK